MKPKFTAADIPAEMTVQAVGALSALSLHHTERLDTLFDMLVLLKNSVKALTHAIAKNEKQHAAEINELEERIEALESKHPDQHEQNIAYWKAKESQSVTD